jgi:hypothetical protein
MPNTPAIDSRSPVAKLSRLLRVTVALLLALYLLDASWFYVRRSYAAAGQASGSVHRRRILAISKKGGKTEYQTDSLQPEEDIPCAHSFFPHAAQKPCWYVTRHAGDPIPM